MSFADYKAKLKEAAGDRFSEWTPEDGLAFVLPAPLSAEKLAAIKRAMDTERRAYYHARRLLKALKPRSVSRYFGELPPCPREEGLLPALTEFVYSSPEHPRHGEG